MGAGVAWDVLRLEWRWMRTVSMYGTGVGWLSLGLWKVEIWRWGCVENDGHVEKDVSTEVQDLFKLDGLPILQLASTFSSQ